MIWYPQDTDEMWVAHDEAIERGGSPRGVLRPRNARHGVERARSASYYESYTRSESRTGKHSRLGTWIYSATFGDVLLSYSSTLRAARRT